LTSAAAVGFFDDVTASSGDIPGWLIPDCRHSASGMTRRLPQECMKGAQGIRFGLPIKKMMKTTTFQRSPSVIVNEKVFAVVQ